ncbi:hypothetical protein TI05_16030 [Achromatium sp. WMS3]|nr:hypothetical protein TI05_16030 [Achromatium sp. WMS3]
MELCNHGARFRWGIENSMQVEKHYGYNYEHVFSYNWNAMRGFHYLMRMGHMFNAIALHTKRVIKIASQAGLNLKQLLTLLIRLVNSPCLILVATNID